MNHQGMMKRSLAGLQFDGDRVAIRKQAARHGLTQLPVKYAELLKKLEGLEGD